MDDALLELELFKGLFDRDIESWFSADIACCDNCYEDFLACWPYADYANDSEFQRQSIPLSSFYEGSRLRETYSEEQFNTFIFQMGCPRCGSPLEPEGNIWPYELPFSSPANFEQVVEELAELATTTPFLLLDHWFCRETLAAIRDLRARTTARRVTNPLYRARGQGKDVKPALPTFDFPPKIHVNEGRYNHAGSPVLYLASDLATCHAEVRGAACLALEFRLMPEITILDLIHPEEVHEEHADLLSCLVYSALVSAKQADEGSYKPHYVVSRFLADCARNAGFDAIRYPSTRMASDSFNLVLLNQTLSLSGNATDPTYYKLKSIYKPDTKTTKSNFRHSIGELPR